MKHGQYWNHVTFAETPEGDLIHTCSEWCELLCSGEGTKSNITCTCFDLGIDVKAERIYLFTSPERFALGSHNWDLLARQSWQLLHWALNASDDSCTCVCSFVRCNLCFGVFRASEFLELKFWLLLSFACLVWKPCWKLHKLLWTLHLVLVTKVIYGSKREPGTRRCFVSSEAYFGLTLCRIA